MSSAPGSEREDAEYFRQFERDYYALLGVARDATTEEIRARFMALSREFHPDRLRKRNDPALIAVANTQYPVLDRAYKVLSDPATRHVYDIYGERGVTAYDQSEELKNVVGLHLKGSDEAQREVEKVLRRLNQQALEAQFSSFSEMSMSVDASDFVHSPMRGLQSLLRGDRRLVERTDMTIHQRTTFPLSRSTNLTLGGYMYDKQGLSMGSFTTRLEYTSNDPSIPSVALYSEMGWTPKLHAQLSQPISPYTVVMWIPEIGPHGLDMSFGVNQLLLPQLHGAMMYSTRDGISASLSNDTQLASNTLAIAVGRGGPNVSLQFRRSLERAAMTVKTSIRANLVTGVSLALGASKEISNRTRLAMGVLLAQAGVTLRLGFTRGSVRFVMPIFLSPYSAQSAFSTFAAATTPFVVSALVTQLVKPAQERKRRKQLEHKREMRRHYLSSARRCALAQQQLMAACAREKTAAEQAKARESTSRGLVVLLARYGKDPTNPDPMDRAVEPTAAALAASLDADDHDCDDGTHTSATGAAASSPASSSGATPAATTAASTSVATDGDSDQDETVLSQQWVDVTVPLQFFVQESTLALPGSSSKASLLGFYNPCAGHDGTTTSSPQLYVRYAFGGDVFEATFDDFQAVSLPSRFAQVMGKAGGVY